MNPYHILGVSPDADGAALQAAYRQLVRRHHPDLVQDEANRGAATARMVKINWAWHILGDAGRRAAFDAQLRAQQLDAAQRQQEGFRAQAQGQVVRGQQAHLDDILKAQALRRQQQNQQQTRGQTQPRAQNVQENVPEQQFLEWQASERARRERDARTRASLTRRARQQLVRQEKARESLARARLKSLRREDRKRTANPSSRRQLSEAARLFGQMGRESEAIALCHDVLRTDGRNVPARELLGDFYLLLGREDRALPLWEQALMLQPGKRLGAPQAQRFAPAQSRRLRATPRARGGFATTRRLALCHARAIRRVLGPRAGRVSQRVVSVWRFRSRVAERRRDRDRQTARSDIRPAICPRRARVKLCRAQ